MNALREGRRYRVQKEDKSFENAVATHYKIVKKNKSPAPMKAVKDAEVKEISAIRVEDNNEEVSKIEVAADKSGQQNSEEEEQFSNYEFLEEETED